MARPPDKVLGRGGRPTLAGPSRKARSVLRLVARGVDLFPLTGLGLLVVAAAAVALFVYGLGRLDLVLLVVGAAFVGLTALGLFAVVITSLVLWLHLRR